MAKTTRDHEIIRKWVEERGGRPAAMKRAKGRGDLGTLCIDLPGYTTEESLEVLDWDDFFERFDHHGLAFIYEDRTLDGALSRFSKLVSSQEHSARGRRASGSRARASGSDGGANSSQDSSKPMDAVGLIIEQHRSTEDLFNQIRTTKDRRESQRLLGDLADLLALHSQIEEKYLYPVMEQNDDTFGMVDKAQDEHEEVKRLMVEILATPPDSDVFRPEMEQLEGLVEAHVTEEEETILPRMREQFDEEQLTGLAQEMTRWMVELQQHSRPRDTI
jgi:hemerythrin superfamily protein